MAGGRHFNPDARGADIKHPMSVDDDKRRTSPVLAHGRYVGPGAVRGKWIPIKVLADGTVVTSGGGGPVPTCPGIFVFCVGPTGSGNTYDTVQAAVDAAELAEVANPGQPMLILVTPGGFYPEDVVIRGQRIGVQFLGGVHSAKVRSLTWTDATLASLAIFNGSADPTDLVKDPTKTVIQGWIDGVCVQRELGAPAWFGAANASLRLLGGNLNKTAFLNGGFVGTDSWALKADGSSGGFGGMFSAMVNITLLEDMRVEGWSEYQGAVTELDDVRILGSMNHDYDGMIASPTTPYAGLKANHSGVTIDLTLNGDEARLTREFQCCELGSLKVKTTAVASVSELERCFIRNLCSIANVGPTVNFVAGRHLNVPVGAGAAGWTDVVGFGS